MNRFEDYLITADSFGADCPDNWEEITDSINEYLTELWEAATEDERERFCDTSNEVWENWCYHEGNMCLPLDLDRIRAGKSVYYWLDTHFYYGDASEAKIALYRGRLNDDGEKDKGSETVVAWTACSDLEIDGDFDDNQSKIDMWIESVIGFVPDYEVN